MNVLGVAEDKEAVRRAVANWDALALEEAIIAARGAGGMGSHHAGMGPASPVGGGGLSPLLEIDQIGDAPPEPLPAGFRPLSRYPGAGPDPRPGRPHLRPHSGRTRRRT